MKKRRILKFMISLVGVIAAVFGLFGYFESKLESLADIEIPEINVVETADGVYRGSYAVFPISVDVEVTVAGHEITDIQILKHTNGQGAPAERIIDKVVESQSVQVDVVAGATYSSKVILIAISNSLNGNESQ